MRATFVEIAGARTRYLSAGSGSPLMLIHGLGTTAERWVRNIEALAANYTVVAPDLPSAGFSADLPESSEPPQALQVKQLEALVDTLGFSEYAVCGSSYGALLAVLLHLRKPKRATRLVIVGSGSALHPPGDQRRTLEAAKAAGTRAFQEGTLEATRKRMAALMHDPAKTPTEALMLQLTANSQPGRAEAMQRLYCGLLASADVAEWQSYPQLERISAPTLMITGRNDPRASGQHAKDAAARIRGSELKIYEDCGHAPMIEHAERFNADLSGFLQKFPQDKSA